MGYPAISGPAWFGFAERKDAAPKRGTKRDAAENPSAPETATV